MEDPTTPECGGSSGQGKLMKNVNNIDYEHELNDATSFLIREWASKLLNAKFNTLKDLTLYLMDKMFVDNRSSAAHTVLSMSKPGSAAASAASVQAVEDMVDVEMKHKPDGILLNGSNPQSLYEHTKRKIDVSYLFYLHGGMTSANISLLSRYR